MGERRLRAERWAAIAGFCTLLVLASAGRAAPAVAEPSGFVIYSQFDHPGPTQIRSQEFEPEFDDYDSELADDFLLGTVAAIGGVDVRGAYFTGPGPAESFNVRFYTNGSGDLPGSLLCEWLHLPYVVVNTGGGSFAINARKWCYLGPGHYWVSVQARMDFGGGRGQWGWTVRTVQASSGAAWRYCPRCFIRDRDLGVWCRSWIWGRRTTCIPGVPDPDQVFRLRGAVPPP